MVLASISSISTKVLDLAFDIALKIRLKSFWLAASNTNMHVASEKGRDCRLCPGYGYNSRYSLYIELK